MRRRSVAWLAIAAVALQGIWPLLALARPAATVLVPLCTVGGETHYYELPIEPKRGVAHEHCALCVLGERAAPPPHHAELLATQAGEAGAAVVVSSGFATPLFSAARPRGPPLLSYVDEASTVNDYGRRNHAAEDLRPVGACIADPGGRVLRGRVLHG
jgi:hypothetical protein